MAIDLVIRQGSAGALYNIGGNNERSNIAVVKMIPHALNKPESLITFVTDRPGHDQRYAIDATKLLNELAWTPKKSFVDGIQETMNWYVTNDAWW